jgi:hypothetical protein
MACSWDVLVMLTKFWIASSGGSDSDAMITARVDRLPVLIFACTSDARGRGDGSQVDQHSVVNRVKFIEAGSSSRSVPEQEWRA